MDDNIHRYDDIIDLPHHVSKLHGHMSMKERAAQFSPFAALTGHSDALDESARLTSKKIELSDDEKNLLDRKLKMVMDCTGKETVFSFTYFIPDILKDGGEYKISKGAVHKINLTKGIIYLCDGTIINIEDIINIDSELFTMY